MFHSRRGIFRFGILLAAAMPAVVSAAYAQFVPREMWAGFGEVPTAVVSHTAMFSDVDADLRIKEARARFQAGDMQRVAERLRGSAGTFDETDLIRFAQSDEREAALVRAIGALLDRRNFDAYYHANEVHRLQPDFENPDIRDREASLVKSLVLTRAGVTGWAYCFAVVDEPDEGKLPLSASLANELRGSAKFITEPVVEARPHPHAAEVVVRVFEAEENRPAASPLWNVVLTTSRGMFLGALVVATIDDATNSVVGYRLTFHDLDRRPLTLADYGPARPDLGAVLEIVDSLTPQLGPTVDRGDEPATPLRAEIESLYWHREQLPPLAMWWARRAGDNSQLVKIVVEPLRESRHDQWRRGDRRDLLLDDAGRPRLHVVGFANERVAEGADFAASREPWIHYQVLVVDRRGLHQVSYSLTSRFVEFADRSEPGGRLYSLRRRTADGEEESPCLLEGEPPRYTAFVDEVCTQLDVAWRRAEQRAGLTSGHEAPFAATPSDLPAPEHSRGRPLPVGETAVMLGGMALSLVALWAVFYGVLVVVRKARGWGAAGVLVIGFVLGLAFAAAVLWSSRNGRSASAWKIRSVAAKNILTLGNARPRASVEVSEASGL